MTGWKILEEALTAQSRQRRLNSIILETIENDKHRKQIPEIVNDIQEKELSELAAFLYEQAALYPNQNKK